MLCKDIKLTGRYFSQKIAQNNVMYLLRNNNKIVNKMCLKHLVFLASSVFKIYFCYVDVDSRCYLV